jgi:ectoine hydroxylase
VLENLFSSDEVRVLQKELELLREQADGDNETRIHEPEDNTLRSIFAIHQSNPLFERLACDSRLVDVARYLLDDEVYIYQSRLNYKPGFRGKEFYWHSDFETWHVEDGMPRMRALSMSITLTENNACNGALMLIPGSHKSYVSCEGLTPENHFRDSLRKQEYGVPSDALLKQLVKEGGIVTADAKPGSVIVFDCNTMHGSNSNITPWPRSNAFFVYNAMSNRVVEPFCELEPRPEYICTRQDICPVQERQVTLSNE